MKKILSLILFFCVSVAHGQSVNNGGFSLKQLPKNVTGEWKFHAGDNPAWADTSFNDSNWKYIDPTIYNYLLPQVVNTQLGWFRLTLDVDKALRGKTVALVVDQYGAAEVYFNGALLRTMGHVSVNYANEQTQRSSGEPLTIQLTNAPKQYIAIRYSFNKQNHQIFTGRILRASFRQPDDAWHSFFFVQVSRYTTRSLVAGSFLLLGILQLAIYFFNRKRKINLYLSLFAFLQMSTLIDSLFEPLIPSFACWEFFHALFSLSAPPAFVFLLAMTYDFFGYKKNKWFYALVLFCVPVIVVQFMGSNPENAYMVIVVYNILSNLAIVTLAVNAVKQKKTGAPLFLAGIIISLLFFLLFNINTIGFKQPVLLENIEIALTFFTPAVVLSILLAREFAQTLFSLRQKLAEVESLSARSIQQEIEKQHLLARQNETLEQKVTERTAELNRSLVELRTTQSQLIQSEKMASLGELTAGIAHEIQNPLNFVNNFSEVNREMLDELRVELKSGNIEEALAIVTDIEQNEEKITHHGKRADGIVKGMLQHSRASSNTKEPTDLNALADEYLRLAYHGLRAKDKTFNAELVTNFDKDLPKVNVVPQDIGRVMLNLFTNAFYAVQQKQKTAGADYKPAVTITTSSPPSGGRGAVVTVSDNGTDIPDDIKDKILQPFFTTKPTGEGTGLGLSLSYDIVVKGHGGTIDIQSKVNEYTEFTISIPA